MKPVRIALERRVGPRAAAPLPSRRRDLDDNVVPFRRRGGVRRSRRGRLRRLAGPFAAALAIVASPTAVIAWVMTSPHFALSEIAVVTGERVSEAWVRRALEPLLGDNLPRLSLTRAEGLLRRHPWVAEAGLFKDLPARLSVRVEEKRAVALERADRDLFYLDASGSRIERFDPLAGSVDLLLVSLADSRRGAAPPAQPSPAAAPGEVPEPAPPAAPSSLRSAVEMADEIEQIAPSWSAGLSEIEVLGEQDFRVYTTSLPFPLLVRAGRLNEKARRLEELLPRIVERYGAVAAVDLRFARRIIVQPSAGGERPPAAHRKAT